MTRTLMTIFPLLLALGCSGPAASRKSDPTPATGKPTPSKTSSAAAPGKAGSAQSPAGTIARAELNRFHKKGPQHFIARLRVKATFRRGRFFGWRILSYRGPGPIKQGDVVIDVLGMPLEKPDQFMKVWENLPGITEVTVKLLRAGKIAQLSFPVVD